MQQLQLKSAALLASLCFAGCQSASNEPANPAAVRPVAAAPVAAQAQTPAAKPAPKTIPDLANPKVASAKKAAGFNPPFPDRLELFEAPKRAQSTVRRDDEHGESVELKGFINVDQPRVILSIDGVISPVPEGGEKYGVHVISIQPLNVVLQRGRNRWTATLE